MNFEENSKFCISRRDFVLHIYDKVDNYVFSKYQPNTSSMNIIIPLAIPISVLVETGTPDAINIDNDRFSQPTYQSKSLHLHLNTISGQIRRHTRDGNKQ